MGGELKINRFLFMEESVAPQILRLFWGKGLSTSIQQVTVIRKVSYYWSQSKWILTTVTSKWIRHIPTQIGKYLNCFPKEQHK
jgi:hypothetical protein